MSKKDLMDVKNYFVQFSIINKLNNFEYYNVLMLRQWTNFFISFIFYGKEILEYLIVKSKYLYHFSFHKYQIIYVYPCIFTI